MATISAAVPAWTRSAAATGHRRPRAQTVRPGADPGSPGTGAVSPRPRSCLAARPTPRRGRRAGHGADADLRAHAGAPDPVRFLWTTAMVASRSTVGLNSTMVVPAVTRGRCPGG